MTHMFSKLIMTTAVCFLALTLSAKQLWSWNSGNEVEIRGYTYSKAGIYLTTNFLPYMESGNIASLELWFYPKGEAAKKVGGTITFQDTDNVKAAEIISANKKVTVLSLTDENGSKKLSSYALKKGSVTLISSLDLDAADLVKPLGKMIIISTNRDTLVYDMKLKKSKTTAGNFSEMDIKPYSIFVHSSQNADNSTTITVHTLDRSSN